ncbi:hypothetical protein GCM10010145_33360 [Streptomyces ruber]|uniref:DUF3291 domain-containing protein n=2 Tax=Streptomyces TaxID=1883 RepID=A0A918BE30_9ACTN|nr:DUF3291 domain-containing protein [Streptomyces ruber]GGQ60570.1 hypothetical protein GCM10010145_33360 [Streptomyces ruber]
MPTLPWVTPNPAQPDTTAFCMASRFELGSRKDVPRFFLKSLVAWGQVRKSPGALGASLEAQLLNGVFFTLSAWESKDALYTYAGTEPHKSIMTGLRATSRRSTFTFWEVPVGQLPLDWRDAKARLEEKARADEASGPRAAH